MEYMKIKNLNMQQLYGISIKLLKRVGTTFN